MRAITCILFALLLADHARAADAAVVRMYDLSDLMVVARDFPPVELGTTVPAGAAATGLGGDDRPDASGLDDVLARCFDPGMAALIREHGRVHGSILALTGSPILHDHVAGGLALARRRAGMQVTVSARLLLMTPRARQDRHALPGLAWAPRPDRPELAFAELSAAEADAVAADLARDPEVELAGQPSLTVFSGQRGNASVVSQVAYLPVAFGGRTDSHRVGVLTLGDTFAVRARIVDDQRFIALELDHARVGLQDMRQIDLGGGVHAEDPVLWRDGERLARAIPAGSGLILATGLYHDADKPARCGFLILTARIIDPDAGAAAGSAH